MAEKMETYLDKREAREVLAGMGVKLTPKQMENAAGPGIDGRRKLPFFKCPVTGRLRIAHRELVAAYAERQKEAVLP